jgi:hypothetical protein
MASRSNIVVETAMSAQEGVTLDSEAIVKVLWAAVDLLRNLVRNIQ